MRQRAIRLAELSRQARQRSLGTEELRELEELERDVGRDW
jgi:hypothetical protein